MIQKGKDCERVLVAVTTTDMRRERMITLNLKKSAGIALKTRMARVSKNDQVSGCKY